MNDTLSIILPAYNAEKTISRALESIFSANIPLEIVLIDDGSVDDTRKICEKYAKEHPQIKFFSQENKGPGAARNKGLKEAGGAYIGFMDADDCYDAKVLEKAWKVLCEDKAGAVCMGIRMIPESSFPDGPGKILYEEDEDNIISGREAFRRMLDGDGLDSNTYAKFYRRDLMPEDLHFYEGMLGDDIPVTYRMLLAAKTVYMMKDVGYLYCVDESSDSLSGVRFKPYFFDMTDRAKELFVMVQRDFPEYRGEAAGFYLDLVLQCVERLMAGSAEDLEKYQKQLMDLFRELENNKEDFNNTKHISRRRKLEFKLFLASVKANSDLKKQ
ncbi:MAG: glycosyltransferase [Butyrivibrio sp.]|nr:glycosyltransferase [Butyrivibrio sp.]